MKNSILVALLCVCSITLFAQNKYKVQDRSDRVAEQLDLTAEQRAEMKEIRTNHRSELIALRESGATAQEKQASRNALQDEMRTEVSRVLSEEQLEKWDEIYSSRKVQPNNRILRTASLDQLNLTSEQQAEVDNMQAANAELLREINSSDQRPAAKRSKIMALRAEVESKMKSILSAEQFDQWIKLKDQSK